MTGCGAAIARKIDQCECHLPPTHPPPHRCDDCGLTWHDPAPGTRSEEDHHGELAPLRLASVLAAISTLMRSHRRAALAHVWHCAPTCALRR